MGSRWVLFPLIMLVSVSVGCSSSSKSTKSSGQTLSGKDEQIFIGDTVEKNYDPNVIMKLASVLPSRARSSCVVRTHWS